MDGPLENRDLRVSDAEREHVVGLLQRATGRGMIDLDEFTERVDAALAARTRAELNIVLLDLPGMTHPERPASIPVQHDRRAHRPAQPARQSATRADGALELTSMLGSVTRKGDWDVPEHLVVSTRLGTAELDFSTATIPHPAVHIEFDLVAGGAELRLPEGARVDRDGLSIVLGSVEDHRRDGDGVVFVLRGTIRAGGVEIKGPRKVRWWKR